MRLELSIFAIVFYIDICCTYLLLSILVCGYLYFSDIFPSFYADIFYLTLNRKLGLFPKGGVLVLVVGCKIIPYLGL